MGKDQVALIQQMALDGFHHLGIVHKMVHLMHLASLLFVLVMLGMLVIQTTILLTFLHDHAYTLEVMMVHHNGR